MELSDSVKKIKGVGEKTASLMEKLNIVSVEDLLLHYPRDYDRFDPAVRIGEIHADGICAVEGICARRPVVKLTSRMKLVQVALRDDAGDEMEAVWFNMPYLANMLKVGGRYVFRGKVTVRGTKRSMEHPDVLRMDEYEKLLHSRQPVYNLTAGLSNKALSKAVLQALSELPVQKDHLPEGLRKQYELCEYNYAIRTIHFPKDEKELLFARKRLVFDEFYLFALSIRMLRGSCEKKKNAFPVPSGPSAKKLMASLPFTLTGGQKRTVSDVTEDMAGEGVMHRLVQGDVGSGKTIVALMALLSVVDAGYQGAMMAPTEVLARQHYASVTGMLERYGISCRVCLLTGSMTAKQKRIAYEAIAAHEADIVIGTHALIQEKVHFDSLALVITDEQHRFGVHQRELLSEKGGDPHVLVMSATPIPRTLAIILYGDLDISLIDELPARRLPIKNCVVGTSYRDNAYRFMEREIRNGHQVYVICPMVEESEIMEGENVLDYAKKLRGVFPPDIHVAHLHGKMSASEKDEVMTAFAENRVQILVSTTVVEVGVDVPNATVMMIENAERFGLAQLHQLRGRVGRSDLQSYCICTKSLTRRLATDT